MNELKSCPFCGYKVITLNSINCYETVFRVCAQCGARTRYFDTPDEADEAWNRRVDNE